MSKKNKKDIVYSTNPDFEYEDDEIYEDETLSPQEQRLTISLDKKQRKGKVVTLVQGFIGTTDDLDDLAKALKRFCGVGGNAKNGEIIIQGDNKAKIQQYLTKEGYKMKLR